MNKTEVMKELESLGNERHLKTFERHGIEVKNAFGVPYADLYKLQKKIGTDQKLAEQLWATGNHDARILAALITDPDQMTAAKLDAWVKEVGNELTLHAVAGVAAKSPTAMQRITKWTGAKQEWVAAVGWHTSSVLCGQPDGLGDDACEDWLETIEATIHDSPNRAKHSMNGALISIGVRNPTLQKKALAAAKRIGTVEVDHGKTSCKTPDAAAYIHKVATHRKKKAAKKKPTRKKKTAARAS